MSLEQAKLFIERLKTDEAFRAKIMAVVDVAERLRLANAEGFDCTEEEINTVSAEVSDADLEGVSAAGEDICICKGAICNCWLKTECHCKGYSDCRQTYKG
jgi:predicted ribosomally synthesized peptide with nif11-like leader